MPTAQHGTRRVRGVSIGLTAIARPFKQAHTTASWHSAAAFSDRLTSHLARTAMLGARFASYKKSFLVIKHEKGKSVTRV